MHAADHSDPLALLMMRLCDGVMDAAARDELAALLRDSAELRQRFVRLVALDAFIAEEFAGAPALAFAKQPPTVPTRETSGDRIMRSRGLWYGAAAMIMLAAGIFALYPMARPTPPIASAPAGPAVVALVSDLSPDAQFEDADIALGEDVSPGRFALTAGRAQLMFRSGAVVDLTGPCELKMSGPNEAELVSGTLHATVPVQAIGFRVLAPRGVTVTDLGTEFVTRVDRLGVCHVQVLSGRVRLEAIDKSVLTHLELAAGQDALVDRGAILTMPLIAPAADPHEVIIDPTLFNAATNDPSRGDDPPGLVENIRASDTVAGTTSLQDAFGAVHNSLEPGYVLFADGGVIDNGNATLGDGGETVDYIEWDTARRIELGGYRVELRGDDTKPGGPRSAGMLRLSVDGQVVDTYDVHGQSGVVLRVLANGPVRGRTFRLELTRMTNLPANSGPRLGEIDAVNARVERETHGGEASPR